VRDVLGAFRQTLTNRQTLGYALAAGGVMGSLFAYVFCSQQVFTGIYGSAIIFRLPSQPSRSVPRLLAFSTPVSSAGSACA